MTCTLRQGHIVFEGGVAAVSLLAGAGAVQNLLPFGDLSDPRQLFPQLGLVHFAGGSLSVTLAAEDRSGFPGPAPNFVLSCPVVTFATGAAPTDLFLPLTFTHLLIII